MKESDVQKRLVKAMRRHHWIVTVFSVPHSVKRQMMSWIDVFCVRWDHAWLIECKGPDGKLTEGQMAFKAKVARHLGPHVDYAVVWPWTELDSILHWGSQFRPHGMEYPPK